MPTVRERIVSPALDLQRSSPPVELKLTMPAALSSTRGQISKLVPGRNTPSPCPTQRGACNDEDTKIRGESLGETRWEKERRGAYLHAYVPQHDHSPTGTMSRWQDAINQSEIISFKHLNGTKAFPPIRGQHQSTPNAPAPLQHGSQPCASKTEYHNLNPSLRILICIIRKMIKDTPMHRIVNPTTMRHLVTILNLKDYAQIPGQVSNGHDKAILLDFATYVWNKGSLRRTRLQDADRRIRCLIAGLGATGTIIPDALHIDYREVTQEKDTFASGAYADVFRGAYRDKRVAVRRLRWRGLSENKCREVLIWSTLAHKNIVPFIGVYTSSDGCLITVSPLMENGTLLSWRRKCRPSMREIERRLREVAEGLNYLHSEGIVHGDLHGNNVLLDSNFRAKLNDFGLSRHLDAMALETSVSAGAYCFSAPELFPFEDNAKVSRTDKSDTFAFACLYYQIHFGCRPFEGRNQLTVPHKVMRGGRARKLPDPPMHDRAWALIDSCWQQVPARRPTMNIVLKSMRSWDLS